MTEKCPHDCHRCRAKELGLTPPFTQEEFIRVHGGLAPQEPGPEKPEEVIRSHDEAREAEERWRVARAAYFAALQDSRKVARRTVTPDGYVQVHPNSEAEEVVREAKKVMDDAEIVMRAARIVEQQVTRAWVRQRGQEKIRSQREAEAESKGWNGSTGARRFLESLSRKFT